ncbi:MAG: GNAT family N-acetyltransferase [Flavobacteriales bacterium]
MNRHEADRAVDLCLQSILEGPDSQYTPTQRAKWADIDRADWTRRLVDQHTVAARDVRGTLVGVASWVAQTGATAWLDHLYVAPTCQRQGVGLSLLQVVEREARNQGMVRLQTQASLHLLPLLLRHGHHVLEHRLAGRDKDLPCAWMEKVLEGVQG